MAKNVLSSNTVLNCPHLYQNETTKDYVFNLTSFVANFLEVSISKEASVQLKALALDFINEHGLERVTFSNARNKIFIKFECKAIAYGNNALDFTSLVEFAFLAGLEVFQLALDYESVKPKLGKLISELYTEVNHEQRLINEYDEYIYNYLYNKALLRKGLEYLPANELNEHANKAPAPAPVICKAIADNKLMIDIDAFYLNVAKSLCHFVLMKPYEPLLENSALYVEQCEQDLFCDLSSNYDDTIGDPQNPVRFTPQGHLADYSPALIKKLAINATQVACDDAYFSGISTKQIALHAVEFVKFVLAPFACLVQAATITYYELVKTVKRELAKYIANELARIEALN